LLMSAGFVVVKKGTKAGLHNVLILSVRKFRRVR
jgi:hypothetical protein